MKSRGGKTVYQAYKYKAVEFEGGESMKFCEFEGGGG